MIENLINDQTLIKYLNSFKHSGKLIYGIAQLNHYMLNSKKKVVLYCCSPFFPSKIFLLLKKHNISPVAIYDDDNTKWGKTFFGIKICSPDTLADISNAVVVVANRNHNSIQNILSKIETFGVNEFCIFDALFFNSDTKSYSNLMKIIHNIYSRLYDDKSRLSFYNIFKYALYSNINDLLDIKEDNEYFPDFLQLNSNEFYLDIGAFDGDTVNLFIDKVNNKFNKIYAIEPSSINFSKLNQHFSNSPNITIINKAAFSSECQLNFLEDENDLSSNKLVSENKQISENSSNDNFNTNTITVLCDEIDNIIPDDENPTYIKMDIEGTELEALKGMSRILKQSQPKLAVCIYHNHFDLWEIPSYLISLALNYRYYVRSYSDNLTDIILYCIPEE